MFISLGQWRLCCNSCSLRDPSDRDVISGMFSIFTVRERNSDKACTNVKASTFHRPKPTAWPCLKSREKERAILPSTQRRTWNVWWRILMIITSSSLLLIIVSPFLLVNTTKIQTGVITCPRPHVLTTEELGFEPKSICLWSPLYVLSTTLLFSELPSEMMFCKFFVSYLTSLKLLFPLGLLACSSPTSDPFQVHTSSIFRDTMSTHCLFVTFSSIQQVLLIPRCIIPAFKSFIF